MKCLKRHTDNKLFTVKNQTEVHLVHVRVYVRKMQGNIVETNCFFKNAK
jgi:hypothetical protein